MGNAENTADTEIGSERRKNSFLLRDLFVLCALSALLLSLLSEVRRPCDSLGRCDSRLCSFLWR